MFHQLLTHLANNWHKYGILLLLIKEFRVLFHILDKWKNVQETLSWGCGKIKVLFSK